MLEAVRMLERGDATAEDIDTAMKLGAGKLLFESYLTVHLRSPPGYRKFTITEGEKPLLAC